MNRSCNSILCRFGIHTADPYVHIQVKCRNGSHRWQSNYEVCKRCGKRLRKIRIVKERPYVEEDENFPQKLGKIAAKACPCCGEQDEGLWRLLGRAEGFEGTVFTEESDED